MISRRQTIMDTICDLVRDFLYYDRKDDEELGVGEIEKAIAAGEITASEITRIFDDALIEGLKP